MQKSTLTIVIPCYNPTIDWEVTLLERYKAFTLEAKDWDLQLMLVNDGSTQNIQQQKIDAIKGALPSFTYYSYENNQGKGHALRYGITRTNTDFILYTDIDMPYSNNSMLAILDHLKKNDVVMAVKQKSYYQQLPFLRKMISLSLQWTIKFLFKTLPTSDTQCGLKAMNRKGQSIFISTTIERYLFDLEFIYLSAKKGLQIQTVPATLREGIVFRKMNNKILLQELKNFIRIMLSRKE